MTYTDTQLASMFAALGQRITALEAIAVTPPKLPLVAGTFDGPVTAGFLTLSSSVGGYPGRRSYYLATDGNGIPANWATSPAGLDAQNGIAQSSLSLKPNPTDVLTGSLDVDLATFAASCPAGAMITLFSEYEKGQDDYPASVLNAAFTHAYLVMKNANAGILVGQCCTAYTATSASKHYPLTQWVAGTGDFYGIDVYQTDALQTPASLLDPVLAQVRAAWPDARFVICETGSNVVASRAAFLADVYAYGSVNGFLAVTFFQGDNATEYIWYPSDSASVAAVALLVSAYKNA